MERALLVLTTVAKPSQARRLARALVAERLCACVSTLPGARSWYRWKGRVQQADEILLLLKTTRRKARALERRLGELHPYDVPEILSFVPERVAPAYANWLSNSLGQD